MSFDNIDFCVVLETDTQIHNAYGWTDDNLFGFYQTFERIRKNPMI